MRVRADLVLHMQAQSTRPVYGSTESNPAAEAPLLALLP